MNEALNTPVRRARREMNTAEMPVAQAGDIDLDADLSERDNVIEALDAPVTMDQVAELAFNEEPVTIMINRSTEKFAPPVVDCWVNGKGAEVFVNGRWTEFNCLPVGMPVTTKRKYVEVLARSRTDTVQHEFSGGPEGGGGDPVNHLVRTTSMKSNFSVLADKSPRGGEWLRRLMSEG